MKISQSFQFDFPLEPLWNLGTTLGTFVRVLVTVKGNYDHVAYTTLNSYSVKPVKHFLEFDIMYGRVIQMNT